MTEPQLQPPQPGARSAYVQSLISTVHERTGGVYRHPTEPHFVQTVKGRKLLQLRPLVVEEGLIEHEWGEQEYRHTKFLLTRDCRLVRCARNNGHRIFSIITPGQLSDDELREITIAICGEGGLTSTEYLRVFGEAAGIQPSDERVMDVIQALKQLAQQACTLDPDRSNTDWAVVPGYPHPRSRRGQFRMLRLGTYIEVTPFRVQVWPITHQLSDRNRHYYLDEAGVLYGTLLRRTDGVLLVEQLNQSLIEQLADTELEHLLARIEALQPWLAR